MAEALTHGSRSGIGAPLNGDAKSNHQSPVVRRRAAAASAVAGGASASRPLSDPMNLPPRAPPAMTFGEMNRQRARILYDMTCENDSREKEESLLQSLREQLRSLPKGDQRERDLRRRVDGHVTQVDEAHQRILFLQSQLDYIDQRLAAHSQEDVTSSSQPKIDYPSPAEDEVRNFAAPEAARQKPKPSRHHAHRLRPTMMMQPVSSAGRLGVAGSGGFHHLRQRSNPETSFIPPEVLQRNRIMGPGGIDPALSMGNIPAPFHAVVAASGVLNTSKSSVNSFRVEGGPSTNASLQSINSDVFNQGSGAVTPPFSMSSHSRSSSLDTNEFRQEPPAAAAIPVEPVIQGLISMLGSPTLDDMASELLAKANSRESCNSLRQIGGIPLLLRILHPGTGKDGTPLAASREARSRASLALHNIIRWQGSTSEGRREMQVLHLLEQVRSITEVRAAKAGSETAGGGRSGGGGGGDSLPLTSANMKLMDDNEKGAERVIERLMQLSFKADYRPAIVLLGGIPAVGDLLVADHAVHNNNVVMATRDDIDIDRKSSGAGVDLRRHCCTVLTNLTFGSEENKASVCRLGDVLRVVVLQLESRDDNLVRSAANLLRNLSWRATRAARDALRRCGAVIGLLRGCGGARRNESGEHEEATLRACTSALWNVSAHSTRNKELLCQEPGGLALILFLLRQWTSVKYSQEIVQNAAGILLNVSSYVSTKPGYRKVLRDGRVYETLVHLLKSGSSEMLKKVCGILWNLSSRNVQDQLLLWDLGAVSLLWSIVNGVHDRETQLAAGQALKNMIQAKPGVSMESVMEEEGTKMMQREPGVGEEARSTAATRRSRFPPSPSRASTRGPAKPPRDPAFQPGSSDHAGNGSAVAAAAAETLPLQKMYSGTVRGSRAARRGHQRSGSYGGMTANHHYAGPASGENPDSSLETTL